MESNVNDLLHLTLLLDFVLSLSLISNMCSIPLSGDILTDTYLDDTRYLLLITFHKVKQINRITSVMHDNVNPL